MKLLYSHSGSGLASFLLSHPFCWLRLACACWSLSSWSSSWELCSELQTCICTCLLDTSTCMSLSQQTHHAQTKLIFIPLFFTPWLLSKWCHCQVGNLGIIFDSRSPTVLHLIFHQNPLVLLSKDLLLYPSPPPLPLKVIILIAVCLVLTLCQAPCLDHWSLHLIL